MTHSPESRADSPPGTAVPKPRGEAEQATTADAGRAAAALTALHPLRERLAGLVNGLDDPATAAPCALPGWSRAHLISHLARNADALVNLLTWARTGVEHQAYASDADRDADIEEGAKRAAQMLQEDLAAASGRLHAAFEEMPADAWSAEVVDRQGCGIPAHQIPWMRVTELVVHIVDLQAGVGFDDVLSDIGDVALIEVMDSVVRTYSGREVPPARVNVLLPGGGQHSWTIGSGQPVVLSGDVADALSWLTGRGDGADLDGDVPELPAWR